MLAQPRWLREVSRVSRAVLFLRETGACWFAHYLSREQIKPFMNKGERISQFVAETIAEDVDLDQRDIARHPFYRAFFHCWNEKRYYEAHDVLEQLWLKTKSPDADYFKGLIQAAGAFVHLQKRFEYPLHSKHSKRLSPQFVCSGWLKGTCAGSPRDITDWMWLRCASCYANTRIGLSNPITRPIPGHRKRRLN